VGLERGPLSLVRTTEELLRRKNSCSGIEIRDYGRKLSAALTTRRPSICKTLALTLLADSGNGDCLFYDILFLLFPYLVAFFTEWKCLRKM
jgi:hypothetical protein